MNKPAPVFNPRDVLRKIRERRSSAGTEPTSAEPCGSETQDQSKAYPDFRNFRNFRKGSSCFNHEGTSGGDGNLGTAEVAEVAEVLDTSLTYALNKKERKNNNFNCLCENEGANEQDNATTSAEVAEVAEVAKSLFITKVSLAEQVVRKLAEGCESDQASDLVAWFDERAGILEYDGGWPRAEAEALAAAEIEATLLQKSSGSAPIQAASQESQSNADH